MSQPLPKKRILLAIVSLAVTVFFVWWFVARQDWSKIWDTFRNANPLCILYSAIPAVLMYLPRTLRWQILMRPVKKLSFGQALGPTLIGFMANNILPFRAGELARPAIVKVRYSASFTATLATIVVERVLDMLALAVMLLFVCLSWSSSSAEELQRTRWVAVVVSLVLVAAVAFLIVLKFRPEGVKNLLRMLMLPLPAKIQSHLLSLIDSFVTGLHFIDSFRDIAITLLYTGAIWTMAAAQMYYAALAFGLEIGAFGACFALLCIALAIAAPQAPGYFGTYHTAGEVSLKVLNLPKANAASFAIVAHAISYLPVTIAGFVALWVMGLSLGQVRKEAEQAEREAVQQTDDGEQP